jgi:accessory gene regulator B
MIDRISNYLVDNVICKDEILSDDEKEILNFGVTRIVEDTPKYIIMLALAIITRTLTEFGIVFLITVAYKTFIGGAHARTNLSCLISSNIIFFLPIIISKLFEINSTVLNIIYGTVFLFSIYVILYIAPADTAEVPILNRNKRNKIKIQGFISLLTIYFISVVFLNNTNIKELIVFTILIIDIYATSPIYKLYKCKYSFESEEFKEYFKENKIIT